MAETKRSFLSTIPGVVTGVAGLLTGVVGLISLSVQQGWIGGGSSKTATTATTTIGGSGGSGGTDTGSASPSSSLSTSRARVTFSFSPTRVDLSLPKTEQQVTVTNTGDAVTMSSVTMKGIDADKFQADGSDCTGHALATGDQCKVSVKLVTQATGTYTASLVLTPKGGEPVTVPVNSKLL